MSQYIDALAGAIYNDWGGDIGPQPDGTYGAPSAAQPNNLPWDTAGGTSGDYSQTILDVLKLGVGAWSANKGQQNLLDYKRFEATAGGTFQQGYPVRYAVPGGGLALSGNTLLLIGLAAVAFMLIQKQ